MYCLAFGFPVQPFEFTLKKQGFPEWRREICLCAAAALALYQFVGI